ncbi:hypothetical protein PENSPDRAFT_758979 [Peniophora sp. CONT]|nr:hypothetical protein PENSPDRAFT_758979 [Peniophora sp. CONT]
MSDLVMRIAELNARHTRLDKLNINLVREENTFLVAPAGATGVDWWPYTWNGAQGFATPTTTAQPAPTQTQFQEPTATSTTASPSSSSTSASQTIALSTLSSSISTTPTATSTSAASIRAANPSSPFKLYLLAPIVGGVGLALLAACIICRRRRRRRHKDTISALEAGPRYESYESKPLYPVAAMQNVSLLRPNDPRDAHRANANVRSSSHRSRRSKRSARGPAQPGLTAASRSNHTLGLPELSERPDSPSVYSIPSRGPSRAMTVLSAHPKNADADESYEDLRHKSIRRGLAERIQSETKGYQAVSDEEDEEEEEMLAYYESGRSPRSAVSARSGPGFRIVQEEPPSPSALNSEASSSWLAWTRGWSASNLNLAEQCPPSSGHSHFTPKPVRRRERTSTNGATTPTARTPTYSRPPTHSTTPTHHRPHSRSTTPAFSHSPSVAMLPASPPLVSSPQFNAALTFGGPDPSARTTASSRRKHHTTSSPSRERTRTRHRDYDAHGQKLPYPGDARDEEGYRRGREQRKKSLPPPPPVQKQLSDVSETMMRASSPREHEGALDKVDAIVARGIVQKRAISEESETAGWMGIQQRLEMLG